MSYKSQLKLIQRLALGLAGSGLAVAAPAFAQRDPAYQAARSSGQVGEQTDGYLGVIGNPPKAVKNLADDINIKRRANYTQNAQSHASTVQEWAFTQGCLLIRNTAPGEKYQGPDGSWQTRTSAAPQLSSKCP